MKPTVNQLESRCVPATWNMEQIQAPALWAWEDSHHEVEPVIVAVLDSGLQLSHPDLAGKLWVNADEVAGNGQDDDSNGYIDDVNGYSWISKSGKILDDSGHGTAVAGLIAATRDNGIGIDGVTSLARIMPLDVFERGAASSGNIANAIKYAVDNGAKVINASFSGAYSSGVDGAIKYAEDRGVLIVAAAGNNAKDLDAFPFGFHPANSTRTNVISVAATTNDLSAEPLASFSNYGADIAAPGKARWPVQLVSLSRFSGTTQFMGTSAAAPHVAGAAAHLMAVHPDWSPGAVREWIISTATTVAGLTTKVDAGGVLNATPLPGEADGMALLSEIGSLIDLAQRRRFERRCLHGSENR